MKTIDESQEVSQGLQFDLENGQKNVSKLYAELQERGLLASFGSVKPGGEPIPEKPLLAADLPGLIGVDQSALTPGGTSVAWLVAGSFICAFEATSSVAMGQDPLTTALPLTLGLAAADRLFFRGAFFESALRALFPVYREKVVRHEAAHFLCAYLLGCPVESCIMNAWDASRDSRFAGAAGTLFFDPVLTARCVLGS